MPAYDNKVLNGAGVAKLSQLVKDAIASGVAEEEIYIGSATPSTSQYKVWIDTGSAADTVVKGVTVNGAAVVLDSNSVANLTGLQGTLTAGDNITITNNVISASSGSVFPTSPSQAGNYLLLLSIDSSGNETLSWSSVVSAWQYPLKTGNNLTLYQGNTINKYGNKLEVV